MSGGISEPCVTSIYSRLAKMAAEGMKAMVSSAKPSFTNCQNMPLRVAPIAMRRPISALLCCVRYQKVPTTPSRTFSRKKAMPAT